MKKINRAAVVILPLLTLVTLTLNSCTDGKSAVKMIPKTSEAIPVRVINLEKTGTATVIQASGQLTTDDESVLGFKTGGVVNGVLVKEGDAVRKGQLLATLDLTEVNALVAQARLGYEKAQRDFHRTTNLYRDSVATLEQVQNAETALSIAKQQWDAAGFNRNFSEIHAPANGYVLRKFVNAGQVVSIGDPVLLTNAVTKDKWVLKIGVSDKQWATINLKDQASVKIDAFPGKTFQATINRKSETSDPATGAFTIELIVKNDGVQLATGMFGAATLTSNHTQSSWSVPYESVLDASGSQGFVFVTSDDHTAVKKSVFIQSFNGKTIQISSGLDDAIALIVSGSAYLTDGSPITIVK